LIRLLNRRHKRTMIAGALVMLALLAGGVTSWSQSVRALEQGRASRALTEAFRSLTRRPGPGTPTGTDVLVGDRLVDLKERIPELSGGSERVEAELWGVLGEGLQGVDRFQDAIDCLRRAESMQLARRDDRCAIAGTRFKLAKAMVRANQEREAEALLREVVQVYRSCRRVPVPERAASLNCLAQVISGRRDYTAALSLYREAWSLGTSAPGSGDLVVAAALSGMGYQELCMGRTLEAEAYLLQAEGILRSMPIVSTIMAEVHGELGQLYLGLGDLDRAESRYREALEVMKVTNGTERPNTAQALARLAGTLWVAKEFVRAEVMFREAVRICRMGRPTVAQLSETINGLGVCLRDQGRLREAEAAIREALSLRREAYGPDHLSVADSETTLARLLLRTGNFDEARVLAAHAAESRSRSGSSPIDEVESLAVLALVGSEVGSVADAAVLAHRSMELRQGLPAQTHWRTDLAVEAYVAVLDRLECTDQSRQVLIHDYLDLARLCGMTNAATQKAWSRVMSRALANPVPMGAQAGVSTDGPPD
jgi:tetratricopeptide (TPR) repeat protein